MKNVDSKLWAAHCYITRVAHTNWRMYADLPGPNIINRKLYSSYGIDSLEVIHRKRRNNFLLKCEQSENTYIREIIGNLPKITI